jgi:hypothetical protein
MEALIPRKVRVMAVPRKYPEELRERASGMALDLRRAPDTKSGALKAAAELDRKLN